MRYERLGSTNDEAMARLKSGDPGGLFVVAGSQTGGRGRQGRVWSSPPGNLYASLALRDPASMALAPQLGFVAGVALAQTLRVLLGGDTRLRIKWPNDMLFGGAKLGGLLLESAVLPGGALACVIGFGVNCRSHPEGLAYPATHLRAAGDPEADPAKLLACLAARFDAEFRAWNHGAGFAATRVAWLALAAGRGERIAVVTPRERLEGIFRDLDPAGRLLIETTDGLTAVDAGDVFLSGTAANV